MSLKKACAVFLAICILGLCPICASASAVIPLAPIVSAKATAVVDQYGMAVYSENADEKLPMASTTKIMTAFVALENADTSLLVKIPSEAVGIEGSSAYLLKNEILTLEDLLYALMLQSANDAATAIAIAIGGSVEGFVEMMNQKADDLGLESTHFTNPHGLDDDDHYSSASDLAKIMLFAMKNEKFATIVGSKHYHSKPQEGLERSFTNHNKLLWRDGGFVGGKTGYTQRTGRCLVSVTDVDGLSFIAVTLNDPNDWSDHEKLHTYARNLYLKRDIYRSGRSIASINVQNGYESNSDLTISEDLSLYVPIGSSIKTVIECRRFEFAPLYSNRSVGTLRVYCNDIEIASADIYPTADIDIAPQKKKSFIDYIKKGIECIKRLLEGIFGRADRA